jgi:hypothetical protein
MNEDFSYKYWSSTDEEVAIAVSKALPEKIQLKVGRWLDLTRW